MFDPASVETATGMRLAQAGVTWDVVKVCRFLGLQALEYIGHPGAIAVDPYSPEPMLYFFVPAGTTVGWSVPDTTPLSGTAEVTTHVVLPPPHREAPPGPYWLLPPSHGLTPTRILQRALKFTQARREDQPRIGIGMEAMRADTALLIGDDAELPETRVLPQIVQNLRGHLMVLIPHVEDQISLSPEPGPYTTALAEIDQARRHMDAVPGFSLISEIKHAQNLARSVEALCHHAEVAMAWRAEAPEPSRSAARQ
ncbi:DUF6415 family natural product biosynthesis protein [Streptomyces acidicola]|uniref:DUF6415 family natural product biosynthesis protein n=1 Tax=Streptomyces acidicola TaxID=2596892 RepID=UPI003817E152